VERRLRAILPHGIFTGVSVSRSATMRAIKGAQNKTTEMRLRAALASAGLHGWKIRPGNIIGNPDVVFPQERVAVFADGCFWHGCPCCGHIPATRSNFWAVKIGRNQQRDRRVSRLLRRKGYSVIRVWEHELADDAVACARTIGTVLRARGSIMSIKGKQSR